MAFGSHLTEGMNKIIQCNNTLKSKDSQGSLLFRLCLYKKYHFKGVVICAFVLSGVIVQCLLHNILYIEVVDTKANIFIAGL